MRALSWPTVHLAWCPFCRAVSNQLCATETISNAPHVLRVLYAFRKVYGTDPTSQELRGIADSLIIDAAVPLTLGH